MLYIVYIPLTFHQFLLSTMSVSGSDSSSQNYPPPPGFTFLDIPNYPRVLVPTYMVPATQMAVEANQIKHSLNLEGISATVSHIFNE